MPKITKLVSDRTRTWTEVTVSQNSLLSTIRHQGKCFSFWGWNFIMYNHVPNLIFFYFKVFPPSYKYYVIVKDNVDSKVKQKVWSICSPSPQRKPLFAFSCLSFISFFFWSQLIFCSICCKETREHHGWVCFRRQDARVRLLALPFTSWGTLDKSLHLSVS